MAEEGYNVTAVDISEEMMKIAHAKVKSIGKDVNFILGDINKLLDSLGSFNGIFSMTAFEFIDQRESTLKKLYQKLNPGGCMVIGVIADNSSWSSLYRELAESDPDSVFHQAHFFTEDEIRSWDIGTEPEIRHALFFPPVTDSFENALEQEEIAQGNPGFLVACWRK